jgi:CBS domain-containing protein
MPSVREFCKRRVVVARREEGLVEMAQRMRDEHVGCVVVVDEKNGKRVPVGMLTDRDIVLGALARTNRQIDALTAADVMTTDVVTARDDEELQDVLRRMRSSGVRRFPVVEADGGLAGFIAFDDLVDWLSEALSDLALLLARERSRERERAAPK